MGSELTHCHLIDTKLIQAPRKANKTGLCITLNYSGIGIYFTLFPLGSSQIT